MSKYKAFIVVNGTEYEMQIEGDSPSYEEVNAAMSQMKEAESIKVELLNGDILAINGLQYKDVYFLARKVEES